MSLALANTEVDIQSYIDRALEASDRKEDITLEDCLTDADMETLKKALEIFAFTLTMTVNAEPTDSEDAPLAKNATRDAYEAMRVTADMVQSLTGKVLQVNGIVHDAITQVAIGDILDGLGEQTAHA